MRCAQYNSFPIPNQPNNKYTPRQKFSILQLHSTFVTNPAEKMQNIKQRYNFWILKESIPQHILVDIFAHFIRLVNFGGRDCYAIFHVKWHFFKIIFLHTKMLRMLNIHTTSDTRPNALYIKFVVPVTNTGIFS